MREVEKVFQNIIEENMEKITNALIMELVNDISSIMIESIAEETKMHYEQIQIHFMNASRKFEEKLKKVRSDAD